MQDKNNPAAARLRRVRWAVRATLMLGVAASVVANVLHALDNPISQTIAAWPPLALLLTVELISRVPVHTRSLAFVRLLATAAIAGIAAWVSYWHMVGVAARYGETGASPYLLPLSVDGLIVVASICLVELSGRLRTVETSAQAVPDLEDVAAEEHFESVPDPWQWSTDLDHEPPREPAQLTAATAQDLAAADRVMAAHAQEPDATNGRIAELSGASLSSVKRHRPARRERAATTTGAR
jgi:hypothetical protein